LLLRFEDSPMARLSQVIALSMVDGPAAGLRALDGLEGDPHFAISHRLDAVRAHLLERAGHRDEAIRHYRRAAERTTSTPERNYLLLHAAQLNEHGSSVAAP
jgi:predicted RNA polymerase sigma factor